MGLVVDLSRAAASGCIVWGGEECLCSDFWVIPRISHFYFSEITNFYAVFIGHFHNSVIKEITEVFSEAALSKLSRYRNV